MLFFFGGELAELADASHSKCDGVSPFRFKSEIRHQEKANYLLFIFVLPSFGDNLRDRLNSSASSLVAMP